MRTAKNGREAAGPRGGNSEFGTEADGVVRIAVGLSDEDVRRIAESTAALLRVQAGEVRESPYMTVEEAAAYLRCRRQRVDDLLSQRRLPRVKDGARTLILRSELEAYLSRGADDHSASRRSAA